MVVVNKYRVNMYEHLSITPSKSTFAVGISELEAIESVRRNPFWYDEGKGVDAKPLKYPLTFRAELNNDK